MSSNADRYQTALDKPSDDFNDFEKRLIDNVRNRGFQINSVFDNGEAEGYFPFSYSIGMFHSLGFPEIITFGLPSESGHGLISTIYDMVAAGRSLPLEQPLMDIANGLPVILASANSSVNTEYLLSAKWFYGRSDFPTVQLLWPDSDGCFPWQTGFDAQFENDQPDFTKHGWAMIGKSLN